MYIKDIATSIGADVASEETVEEILDNLPDDELKAQIVRQRTEQAIMPDDEMFRQGSVSLSEYLPVIKDALLCKDGLVEPDKQDLFREQVASTLNEKIMKSLSSKTQVKISDFSLSTNATNSTVAEESDVDS